MSRVGNVPIIIPSQVSVEVDGQKILVKGSLGQLMMEFLPQVTVTVEDNQVVIKRKREDRVSKSLHGLTRSLLANMVIGVEKGWEKKLELIGVGFRAQTAGDKLTLAVGYSHPVEIQAPPGIKFDVADNTKITVSGIDKALVGQVAASIRKVRPPEPYQGKGIRYSGEYVRRKAGKASKVGAK
ncbi:MAG: 50S ribosomal protein L6 [Candidatus Daviesbacteria bacterium GW2011_GWA1_41_61]|uniref:Large ribosomal subunit protein uL6 n=1 Tax=Candidatus Daviesbacteria bacterium GW2011_GWA2_40_9 TaxID=1618424 RepID=A0A0G0X389_9BACT|nr:MAG: 50S ribosomal protein L6 [Candidatus Daviesbacteria bacterium GW2011_GWC1_40_9]KKR82082.1 MAG: 50S ribosomal protein L6 [Candidatus Daviesbacteria bacterium GW2011_GWA2_40_9]KKR93265.1 MAG: 50S ribosomal protein L6 [Candidatus Daviesbacteria bacterium GW2011_GWB1_41_15]KKS14753.1 MAG: 50S ribosomal protein L6 [Candidatus Daviesbacteria bacterium GW2011_GWA1_41_61]